MNSNIGKRITMNGGLKGNDWLDKTQNLVFQSIFGICPKKSVENWPEFGLKLAWKMARNAIRFGPVRPGQTGQQVKGQLLTGQRSNGQSWLMGQTDPICMKPKPNWLDPGPSWLWLSPIWPWPKACLTMTQAQFDHDPTRLPWTENGPIRFDCTRSSQTLTGQRSKVD